MGGKNLNFMDESSPWTEPEEEWYFFHKDQAYPGWV